MLDPKHANIGNTVGMIREIHKLSKDTDLAEEITKLFMAESDDCDYKNHEHNLCAWHVGDSSAGLFHAPKCMVGVCPLGPLSDKDRKFGSDPEEDRMQLYGRNTMSYGGHVHIGYTGWRKYVYPVLKRHRRAIKGAMMEYWKDRMYYLKWFILIPTVYFGSAAAGHLSIYIW